MKSQNFKFYSFGEIKSRNRLLLIILSLATSTYNYSQQPASCVTDADYADASGLKVWCWNDLTLPTGITDSFTDGTLALNVECDINDVYISDGRLHFDIDPVSPVATCGAEIYNKRAEIRTMPWPVKNPLGTEEWIGFNYKFENDYVIDSTNEFLFYQHHQGVTGSPPWDLSVFREGQRFGNPAGEIFVVNHSNDNAPTYYDRTATGVVPQPGQSIDVVIHVVHNTGTSGLLQIWIDGVSVYNKQTVTTVWNDKAWGGNAKVGLYMYRWTNETAVTASANAGVTSIHTSMGALRIITRLPSDPDYLQDDYVTVFPSVESEEVSAGGNINICDGSSTTLTATGSQSYVWETGETTQSITVQPTQTTTYTVTGTDSEGNESTDSVTVTVNPLPIANAGTDQEICQDESITLTVSGGDSYEWDTGQTSQSITVSPEDTTTYTVTVTNNGCSATDDVTVTVNPRPAINAGNDVEINQGDSTTLTAAGDGTFIWSTGEETQSITVSPTATATYTVTATLNGCTSSDSVTVSVLEPETVSANAGEDKTICENESVTLTASGGTTYLWSTGETTQSIEVSPTSTTTYTVTVYNNSVSDSDDVIVNVNPTPIADAGEERAILSGDSIPLTATGGSEFLWSTGETTQEIIVSPTETTTYTVEVFENGCSDIASVTVIVGVSASVGGEQIICQGESTTLYANGGSYYLWSTGQTTQSIDVSPSQTSTYSVVVSNNTSSDEAHITVNVNLLPSAYAGEDVTIESGQNVILTGEGGNTYLWSNGETTQSISVSPTDTTVYAVESIINGCSDTDDVKVSVVQQVNANAGQDMEICFGESATLTASGGEFYLWSTGEETASISVAPDETTTYTVEVSNGFSTQTANVMVGVLDCQAIGTEPDTFGFEFRVYPNPTDSFVNIKFVGLENVSSIFISNLTGQVISSERFEHNDGYAINKQYDLSSLTKGIYFVTFKQIGEPPITKKIILQ